jgi:hypothetical protein
MNIFQMLKKLNEGKKITHESWDYDSFIRINENKKLIDEIGDNYTINDFIGLLGVGNTGWHLYNRKKKETVVSKNIPPAGTILHCHDSNETYTIHFSNDKIIFAGSNLSDSFSSWRPDFWKSTARFYFKPY